MLHRGAPDPDLATAIFDNPFNGALIGRLAPLGLPQCHLTAGCLFQSLWNRLSGHPADWGIADYDVFYFDDRDLSWEAEDRVIRAVAALTADLPIRVDVKNQARVHLWYRERFGSDYPRLTSVHDGIDRYLVSCTCVGIDLQTGALYAPDGPTDLIAGKLRMNPLNPQPALFRAKAERYRQRWPWLEIVAP